MVSCFDFSQSVSLSGALNICEFMVTPSSHLACSQVNIGLRVLTRPLPAKLPEIYRTLGTDYAERVLPSIIQVLHELLRKHVRSSSQHMSIAE